MTDIARLRDTVDVECDIAEKGALAARAELYENAPQLWMRFGTVTKRAVDAGIASLLHRLRRNAA